METRAALKGQYLAGLAMLRQCIEKCPDEVWSAGIHPRTFWRIAYHTLFYAHLYLMPTMNDMVPWEKNVWHGRILWEGDEEGLPPNETTFTQAEMIEYLEFVYDHVNEWVDALDLESPTSGFDWYRIPKLDHQLVNIRHIGVHVGQLQELLYAQGIDVNWIGRR